MTVTRRKATKKRRKKKTTRKSKEGAMTNSDTAMAALDTWATPAVSSSDIVIPRLLAMQGLSEMVIDGKAKFGEFRESLSGKLLGSLEKPVEFIPFFLDKKWIVEVKKPGGKFEYSRIEKVTPLNEAHPFECDGLGDEKEKWTKVYEFYVLLPGEVELGASLPYILSFSRTSFRAGRKLLTQMYVTNRAAKKVPAAQVMSLVGKKTENDQGTFVVMDVKTSRAAKDEEVKAAYDWMKTIQSGASKADGEEVPF